MQRIIKSHTSALENEIHMTAFSNWSSMLTVCKVSDRHILICGCNKSIVLFIVSVD